MMFSVCCSVGDERPVQGVMFSVCCSVGDERPGVGQMCPDINMQWVT